MARPGPRKIQRYTNEFKLKAVKLTEIDGIQVKDVAESLDIHPFMLSRWRKEVRDGVIKARVSIDPAAKHINDLREFAKLKREHALLKEEHELLKKPSGSVHNNVRKVRVHPGGTGPVPSSEPVPAAGVHLATMSKRVGHSNISMTANIYTHRVDEDDRKAAEAIADLVFRDHKDVG